jgi:rhodanese-related sulfurtransferase
MKKSSIIFLLLLISLPLLCGCNGDNDAVKEPNEEKKEEETMTDYVCITQEEAKRIIDTEEGYIILDVRTIEEFESGHIPGAILIPDYEIEEKAPEQLTDKSQLILVYCRSGRRSKIASEELVKLGYTNIKEFGGIIDWKYGVVK